jgi:hypothetical protein
MTHTSAASQSEPDSTTDNALANSDRRPGAPVRHLLVALRWPAQLVNASAVITSTAQAQIAQHFHTTQVAWYSLTYALFGTTRPSGTTPGWGGGSRRTGAG